jgi:hypothetical protein
VGKSIKTENAGVIGSRHSLVFQKIKFSGGEDLVIG